MFALMVQATCPYSQMKSVQDFHSMITDMSIILNAQHFLRII